MSAEPDDFELSDVPREVKTRFGVVVSYAPVWNGVVRGDFPAHRVGRRWRVKTEDLGIIAEAFRAVRRPKLVA
jgi:hypothetical protein